MWIDLMSDVKDQNIKKILVSVLQKKSFGDIISGNM